MTLLPVLSFAQGERDKKLDTIFRNQSYVDFDRYIELAMEVQEHRKERLVSFEDFMEMAQDSNTIILDTRSKEMYDAKHIKGAIHLNFSDFNMWSLNAIAPDTNTRILIYCNNNFDYTDKPVEDFSAMLGEAQKMEFVTKVSLPRLPVVDVQLIEFAPYVGPKKFPLTMALNIPTYINLYGYGYKNVYELGDLISVYYSGIEFEGTSELE